jgi:hypothetical protein
MEAGTMNPVELAIAPLKAQAMERAEIDAKALVLRVWENLADHGWDLNKAAPYPRSMHESRISYKMKVQKYHLYSSLVKTVSIRSPCDPHIVRSDEAREAKFIKQAIEEAAAQYVAFVAKMVGKIGPCDSATLQGSHVWGYSILTVKKGAAVERWKTQQIVNQSKLGTLFNQWPSRLIKA